MEKALESLQQSLQVVRDQKNIAVKNQNYLEARILFLIEKDLVEIISDSNGRIEFLMGTGIESV